MPQPVMLQCFARKSVQQSWYRLLRKIPFPDPKNDFVLHKPSQGGTTGQTWKEFVIGSPRFRELALTLIADQSAFATAAVATIRMKEPRQTIAQTYCNRVLCWRYRCRWCASTCLGVVVVLVTSRENGGLVGCAATVLRRVVLQGERQCLYHWKAIHQCTGRSTSAATFRWPMCEISCFAWSGGPRNKNQNQSPLVFVFSS